MLFSNSFHSWIEAAQNLMDKINSSHSVWIRYIFTSQQYLMIKWRWHHIYTAFTRSTVLAQHGSVRRWNCTGAHSHEHDNKLVFVTFDPTHTCATSLIVMLPGNVTANAYSVEVKISINVERGRRAVVAVKILESEARCNHYDTVRR